MTTARPIDALARFYESLTADKLSSITALYAADARFKDPFNDVVGVAHIERIFEHMFVQVESPHFEVTRCFDDGDAGVLLWTMHWGEAGSGGCIEGASRVSFDDNGKVVDHRDYWDPAESLYEKVPILGAVMRRIKRRLATD
ncbi:nuclear transport factor 2 family protein [Nitrogeniibacter aestuarii]|uniref:nuclear transport factor 2 family protein n=1 Tax=Nitrogeniibacter aestuarii TaxID=2815343 RepID=UPI001D0F91E4|nr:nuclear transport factor 2 family protein [Nitrogeniibacter aestuarii]